MIYYSPASQAFALCRTGTLNLSYESLTSREAKAKLLEVEESDPEFWAELTQRDKSKITPPGVVKGKSVPEDMDVGGTEELHDDDSEVPTQAVVEHVVHGRVHRGVKLTESGGLVPSAEAESTEPNLAAIIEADANERAETEGNADEGLGRGKRKKIASTRYSGDEFWQH